MLSKTSVVEYRSVEERMCEGSGNDRSRWSRLYCEINGQLHLLDCKGMTC